MILQSDPFRAIRGFRSDTGPRVRRHTPETQPHKDPLNFLRKAWEGVKEFATTPLIQSISQTDPVEGSFRDFQTPQPGRRIGPPEQPDGPVAQAYQRAPIPEYLATTDFPPVALARGAFNTFVRDVTPIDVALEVGLGAAATTAPPLPARRLPRTPQIPDLVSGGDLPFDQYGKVGQDYIDRLYDEALQARNAPPGESVIDEAMRRADESMTPPEPGGGSLMGRPRPQRTPRRYEYEDVLPEGGGSLIDESLSQVDESLENPPRHPDDIPYTPEEAIEAAQEKRLEKIYQDHFEQIEPIMDDIDAGMGRDKLVEKYGDEDLIESAFQQIEEDEAFFDLYGEPDADELAGGSLMDDAIQRIDDEGTVFAEDFDEPLSDFTQESLESDFPEIDDVIEEYEDALDIQTPQDDPLGHLAELEEIAPEVLTPFDIDKLLDEGWTIGDLKHLYGPEYVDEVLQGGLDNYYDDVVDDLGRAPEDSDAIERAFEGMIQPADQAPIPNDELMSAARTEELLRQAGDDQVLEELIGKYRNAEANTPLIDEVINAPGGRERVFRLSQSLRRSDDAIQDEAFKQIRKDTPMPEGTPYLQPDKKKDIVEAATHNVLSRTLDDPDTIARSFNRYQEILKTLSSEEEIVLEQAISRSQRMIEHLTANYEVSKEVEGHLVDIIATELFQALGL